MSRPLISRLDRYIVRQVLGFSALVALALVAIYSFVAFVGDLDETGRGGFGLAELALYTLLGVPEGLAVMLPIIALLGTLLGLGALAGQGELTAMRAAGVTHLRIGAAALLAGAGLGVLAWALGDALVPYAQTRAEQLRSEARYGQSAGAVQRPIWLRDGNELFHIRRLVSETEMAEITRYSLADDLSLRAAATVARGRYQGEGRWQFEAVQRSRFEGDQVTVERLPEEDYRGGLSPEVLRLFVLRADALDIAGSLRLIAYLEENGLEATASRVGLWQKLVAPFTVMALTLFAVPFVFGPQRGGHGQRLLIGVGVGLAFFVLNEVAASLAGLYRWPPALAISAPTLLITAAGLWRLQRAW
ncbi:MAG TPA: LPS export ABC transporter permease LptG [Nevskiaceae bacterium]|nr:LPS export ABC transporter permease LptG [Nevskiaceae bacterium]